MAWELKVLDEFKRDILMPIVKEAKDVVDEAREEDPEVDIDDVIYEAIDGAMERQMIYNVDQLAAVQAYGKTWEAFMLVYDEMASEAYDLLQESLDE